MKLMLDPMPALRAVAEAKVNRYFAELASADAHRDAAHARKKQIAEGVMLHGSNAATPEFAAEAQLRNIAVAALATTIVAKPSAIDARELHRQKVMMAIGACGTPAALDALLSDIGKDQ